MNERLERLERIKIEAKEEVNVVKQHKDKEFRDLEKLYYRLRCEFKEVQESCHDFVRD